MSDWSQLDKEYMMSTYCRTEVAIERGKGAFMMWMVKSI